MLSAFNLTTPAQGETGTPSSAINTFGGIEAGGWGDGTSDQTDPKVFATIVIFDKNYKFLDVSFAQLTSSGSMLANYTVKEAGYAFMYVSNEQAYQTDVYFDDISMSYTPTNVVQSNEYYPFGLQTANSWTRDNTTNNFLYDAGSELNTTSGMYDLPYRNYDAALGRFFQVDPMATSSHNLNPYHYAGNNPIGANDPTGLVIDYSTSMENPSYADAMRREWEMGHMNHLSSEWYNNSWDLGMMFFGRPSGGNNWHEDDDKKPTILSTHIDAQSGIATSVVMGVDGNLYTVSVDGEGNYVLNNAFSNSEEEDGLTQGAISEEDAKDFAAKVFGWPQALANIKTSTPDGYRLIYGGFYKIGTSEGGDAVTLPAVDSEGKPIENAYDIYLAPNGLQNDRQLFITLGHEYVHVYDAFKFGYPNSISAKSFTEYNAYSWSIAAAGEIKYFCKKLLYKATFILSVF